MGHPADLYCSAPHQFLQLFGVSSTCYRNLGGRALQFAEIFKRKFDVNGSNVFLQPMQFGRARDGNDPRFLRQQPGEGDLSRCRLFLLCEFLNQIHQPLICFPVLWGKARDNVAEVALVKLRIFADLAREETFAQRTEWNEPDARAPQGWGLPPPQALSTTASTRSGVR